MSALVPVTNKVSSYDFEAINQSIDRAQAQGASRENTNGADVVTADNFFSGGAVSGGDLDEVSCEVSGEFSGGVHIKTGKNANGASNNHDADDENEYEACSEKELVNEINMLKRQMRYLERRESTSLNKANNIHRKIIDTIWELQRTSSGKLALNLPYDDRSNCILVDPVELLTSAKGAIKILVSEHQDMEREESARVELQRKRFEEKIAALEKETRLARKEKFSSEQALLASETKRKNAEHQVECVLAQSDESLKKVVADKDRIAQALQDAIAEQKILLATNHDHKSKLDQQDQEMKKVSLLETKVRKIQQGHRKRYDAVVKRQQVKIAAVTRELSACTFFVNIDPTANSTLNSISIFQNVFKT